MGVIEHSESLIIPTVSSGTEPWTVTISLNKLPVEFQIDTGADVSVISEQLYKKLKAPSLENKSLIGPSQDTLQVCGQFNGTLVYKGNTIKEPIYVVKGLQKALIGCPAITALALLSRVNAVSRKWYPSFRSYSRALIQLRGSRALIQLKGSIT